MSLSSPVTTSPILPPSPLPDQHSCYFHNANDQRLTSGLVSSSHFLTMVRRSARIAAKNHVHVPLTLLDLPPEVRILMYEALLDDMLHMKRELSVPRGKYRRRPFDWRGWQASVRDGETGLRVLWVCKQLREELRTPQAHYRHGVKNADMSCRPCPCWNRQGSWSCRTTDDFMEANGFHCTCTSGESRAMTTIPTRSQRMRRRSALTSFATGVEHSRDYLHGSASQSTVSGV